MEKGNYLMSKTVYCRVGDIEKTYNATGAVLGRSWGGGQVAYPSEKLTGYDTKEALIKDAEEQLKNGSLDSGFGFESLKGAVLIIEEVSTVVIDKKNFHHEEYETVSIGDVTENEEKFLINSLCD